MMNNLDIEKRENSRKAMLHLLRIAQAGIETGRSGEMPLDEISEAKSFYEVWEENRIHTGYFFLAHTLISFLFFTSKIGLGFAIFWVIFVWAFYTVSCVSKRKYEYIRYLLGDMSHLKKKQKDAYMKGLRYELWKIMDEPLRYIKQVFGCSLMCGGFFLVSYLSYGVGILVVFLGLIVIYLGKCFNTVWEERR